MLGEWLLDSVVSLSESSSDLVKSTCVKAAGFSKSLWLLAGWCLTGFEVALCFAASFLSADAS